MELEIPHTKLLIAIFACTLSIVSTTDYLTFDDTDRITRNATALTKSGFRRYIDVPETLHVLRRSAWQDRSNHRHRHHRPVVINVTTNQLDSFDFEHPPEYKQIVGKFYLTNLHTADRLAENTVFIFGYILESPNSGLTLEQYSSLEIIHNAIKRRQFHMYRLLRVLGRLKNQPSILQLRRIMSALSAKLPPYLACAAKFLVSQINLKLLDVETLRTDLENLNFLRGISENEIASGGLYVKEMEQNGYDNASRITEAIVGPFFVHIFAHMSNHMLVVTQPLFASILLNLPNRDGDPIFNEYIRFVAKIAWEGKIPNWSAKSYTPITGDDVNVLIDVLVFEICRDPDVSYAIRQALWYIRDHFERSVKHIVALSANEAYRASQDGLHIDQLLDLITPQEFSPHANRLKAQLTEYIVSHQFVIQNTLAGMNLYRYTSPKQLLLACLTRLRTRLPAEEIEIRKSVSALLSILMLKRYAWNFSGLQGGGITLWTLLDMINDSQTNPKMAELVQTILNELLERVELWSYISNMNLYYKKYYKNKCDSTEICLREMLQILVDRPPPDRLSPKTNIIIRELIDMITFEINRLSISVVPKEPSESPISSEKPSEHYDTTTVRPSIPASSETPPEKPPVHYDTTTVGPSIPASSEPPSEKPPVHYDTTTVGPYIPASSETPSEEPPVHYDTTTVMPSVPASSEPPPEEPPVHYDTTTVRPSIPASSETPPEKPPVHYDTTTVRPYIPASSETLSEEPPVHYDTTTVMPSVPASSEPPPEEPPVHYDTTTVGPSIPASSEPPSEKPPVQYDTTTVRPSIPASSEPPSEEPPVRYDTTTVKPSVPATSEPPSEEPPVHYDTTTVRPSIPASSEPPSEEPPVRYDTTTVKPSVPATSEPPSEEPPVHYDTTTVRPSVPATSEPPTEVSPVHYDTTTIAPSTKLVYTSTVPSVLPIESNKTVEEDILMVPLHVLPPSVNPEEGIHVLVPDSGFTSIEHVRINESSDSSDIVIIPSIVCLQETPSADKFKAKCEKDLIPITQILIREFGEDYIQVLLGDEWRVRYPTGISFLIALLEKAEKSGKLPEQTTDLKIITRYKVAFRFVSSYVLLPLIASSRNLTTRIVWLTYNPENPSECNIGSDRPHELGKNVLTLPLVNPTAWHLPVDTVHPFVDLLPHLPPDDQYAVQIQPLTQLFKTGDIIECLGSDWNPSQYTNRGALFTSVLHILLKLESVQLNLPLYDVVRSYVIAIERSALYIHIPRSYLDGVIQQYHKQPETYVTMPPSINVQWNEKSIETVTAFVKRPLTWVLPPWVYPGISIHVKVSDRGMASVESPNSPASPDVVILPSFDCLLNKPRPEDNPKTKCQRDLIPISQPLRHIFGANYIQEMLGNNWEISYPTRISLLVALLTTVEQNPKYQNVTEFIAVINRYKAACEFVASYVLLPIVVDSQHLNTITVWSTFDLKYPWQSTIGSHEADGFGPNAISLPLTNPKIWLTSVDNEYPFVYLLPYLPENDPHSITLQPLFSLFESGKIKELLGSSWKSSDYPDRGSLFVSVLRTLLTLDVVNSNQKLYTLVFNYLKALELPALYVHVPYSYVKTVFAQFKILWMEEKYIENIEIPNHIPLPPLINREKILQVIVPESGAPVIESVRSKKRQSKVAVILPSVNCLQGPVTAEDDEYAGDSCDSVLEFRLTEPLIEVFGDDYAEKILGANWGSLYPTRISFLAALVRNVVNNKIILENSTLLHKKVKSFKEALEVTAPYIFLPMLANYQKLVTPIVWLTYNYDKPWESHMGRNPPQEEDNSTVTLPLVNPKVWYLPVNRHHPFSGLLPDFPTTNSYEQIIAPLRSVLTLKYLRNLTGSGWEPSQYPNRGVFFVSAMHTLLKLGPTRMNPQLYSLVRSYYMAIEIPSLYIHIPRSYISNAVKTARGAWNVDLDGLMVALMEARTAEERRYHTDLKIFLKEENLLKRLYIVLPSSTTTKHVFLLTIIKAALSSKNMHLAADMTLALKSCQERILTTGAGAEVVGWIWVSRVIQPTIIDLVTMMKYVIPIERIPEENRGAYHDLMGYFTEHPDLQKTDDFSAYRYHTWGALFRGYLHHLVYKSHVSDKARENIELVIPYIRYTGPGATPMHWRTGRAQ